MPTSRSAGSSAAHWFEDLADHLGEAYLRYSFTKGTVQEVDALCRLTGVHEGRVLDIGCGPGRHALEFARRGFDVVGLDISARFVTLAQRSAAAAGLTTCRIEQADARSLDAVQGVDPDSFDLVISLCQGAFGLTGGPAAGDIDPLVRELDENILGAMARACRPGGRVAVSAFSAYFQVHHMEPGPSSDEHPAEEFDAASGVNHEWTTIIGEDGASRSAELWTTCYTPRELRLLARLVGLRPLAVHGVTPGRYQAADPSLDCPEFLLIAGRFDGDARIFNRSPIV